VDETSPFPSDNFGLAAMEALAKAGTVMLPSPPPASGTLYLGINPHHNPDLPSAAPQYYLRLVQTVGPKQVITRIVGLDGLRGVSLPAGSTAAGGASRVFSTVNTIAEDLAHAMDALTKAKANKPGAHEVCLFKDAVIHVPESASVFVRVQHEFEFAASAAEAAEDIRTPMGPFCTRGCGS
jgi:hypothetical protein